MFLSYDTVEAFAVKRNPSMSFPFLKENGELLSVCANAAVLIEPRALELYMNFYDNAVKLTERYPQYYRFTLGMVLDLELGGIVGDQGQRLARYIAQENYVRFDTSDVRKLETLSMLRQAGQMSQENETLYEDIVGRIDDFVQNPAWYTKFNKPLFYDLTHIIFFLTDYGKQPNPLQSDLNACLMHMGTLALLDNDADLLSEICVCLLYIGRAVPEYWDAYLTQYSRAIRITYDGTVASALNPNVDEYHIYLVLNAYHAVRGRPVFQTRFGGRAPSFSLPQAQPTVLEKLSHFSHQQHFAAKRRPEPLGKFVTTLDKTDYCHWQSTLASSKNGQDLIEAFSGLS